MVDFDSEVMWASDGTGEDFQCVHVDFAREQQAEIERLKDQLSHAVPAIEQLTKEREEYRTRWLASEVELRLALEALAHEQAPRAMTPREEELVQKALLASSEKVEK